jgi:glycerol-3-phosphate dehydrogenase (NAD(P)+)
MFKTVTIIGDGGMGSVCAMLLCQNGVRTTLWGYEAGYLAEMAQKRENVRFLPGYPMPAALRFEADDAKAFVGADLLVSAVPCQFTRKTWQRLAAYVPDGVPVVSVTKGIENNTLLRPTEILRQVLGEGRRYAVLSGPTIADELARGLPATATAACSDLQAAQAIQQTFNTAMFRVYTNDDCVGVELAGAMKNVIAIAAGTIDGVGAGDNAKAALVCRGLAEIQRLGVAMGAREKTFTGLSGLGDLVTTCISPMGRNRSFGERIGKGMTAQQSLEATHSVVEGVSTCAAVLALAKRHGVEMPITEAVHAVISGQKDLRSAIANLMGRQLKGEF